MQPPHEESFTLLQASSTRVISPEKKPRDSGPLWGPNSSDGPARSLPGRRSRADEEVTGKIGGGGPAFLHQQPSTAQGPPSSAAAPYQNNVQQPPPMPTNTSSNAFATGSHMNCGNYITERPTTLVAKPPGGGSSIVLG